MCGRYVLKATLQELERKYGAVPEGTYSFDANYNVAPSLRMPVVVKEEEKRVIAPFRWGLIPFWADSIHTGYSMINARSESLAKKKSFSKPFRSQRCVVPANGFYEWKKTSAGKIPYYITLKSSPIMTFAGLYEEWKPAEGKAIKSYTIITTGANKPMEELHDRMPAILLDEELETWLDPQNSNPDLLRDLLRPWPDDDIQFCRVGQEVNNTRNFGEQLIEPYRDLFS
jgi:putative SOS response-associated peptidase YedK